jgi:LPS-assembly lipoprotein
VTQLRQTWSSGVQVYTGAPYKLFLAREEETQRIAQLRRFGPFGEYEVTTVLKYDIHGSKTCLLLSDKLEVEKVFIHDGNNLIGSDQEADRSQGNAS